jgi:hydroxymethylbilane synthase
MSYTIKIGTRASKLAIAQSNEVKQRLASFAGIALEKIEIIPIKTSGDVNAEVSLLEIGGKGLFTKEIAEALLKGHIDMGVHSLKDMPAFLPKGLEIGAILPREDVRDALCCTGYDSIASLPLKAVVGTSSPRRASILKFLRPDLTIVPFRGNVDTRLQKISQNIVDASILAVAGLKRLNINPSYYNPIDTEEILPAPAQGAIAVDYNSNNTVIKNILKLIDHQMSNICVSAERIFLQELGANCNMPVAALAEVNGAEMRIRGLMADDGGEVRKMEKTGPVMQAEAMAREVARGLMR